MSSLNIYEDTLKSLLKFCKDFSDARPLLNFKIEDFDAHADINEFASANYIGVMEYEMMDSGGPLEVTCMLGIMSFQDTKIITLRKTVGELAAKLRPGARIDLVNGSTGQKLGNLIVSSMQVLPISREAKNRPVQFIGVHFLSDMATSA